MPLGFQEVDAPRFLDNWHMKRLRLALRTGHLCPPGNIPGIYLCHRLSRHQGHSATGRITSMKNSNDTIGNRNLDLTVSSAMSQPTAPPRAPSRIRRLRKQNLAATKNNGCKCNPADILTEKLVIYCYRLQRLRA
jgi:hypothetical protein